MKKLIVVGQKQNQLITIKQQLRPLAFVHKDLRVVTAHPSYIESALEDKLSVMIIDGQENRSQVKALIKQIRQYQFHGPIIVLGEIEQNFSQMWLEKQTALFFLAKPFEDKQLLDMVENGINIENFRLRRDQRFEVREQATLEGYSSDLRLETLINNISSSGVRIQGDLAGLRTGDLLRLHFNFDQIQKERTMNARVVWLQNGDDPAQAGLEFVSQKAVYQYLLDNVAA